MDDLLHSDLSASYKAGLPVSETLSGRPKPTIQLTSNTMIWSVLLGIIIGVLSVAKRGEVTDYVGMFLVTPGTSIPGSWFGLVLVQIFPVNLGLLPAEGLDG